MPRAANANTALEHPQRRDSRHRDVRRTRRGDPATRLISPIGCAPQPRPGLRRLRGRTAGIRRTHFRECVSCQLPAEQQCQAHPTGRPARPIRRLSAQRTRRRISSSALGRSDPIENRIIAAKSCCANRRNAGGARQHQRGDARAAARQRLLCGTAALDCSCPNRTSGWRCSERLRKRRRRSRAPARRWRAAAPRHDTRRSADLGKTGDPERARLRCRKILAVPVATMRESRWLWEGSRGRKDRVWFLSLSSLHRPAATRRRCNPFLASSQDAAPVVCRDASQEGR